GLKTSEGERVRCAQAGRERIFATKRRRLTHRSACDAQSVAGSISRSLVDQGCAVASARSARDKSARSRASSSATPRQAARCACRWRAAAPASVAQEASEPFVHLRAHHGPVFKKVCL